MNYVKIKRNKIVPPKQIQLVLECQILSPLHVGTGEEIPVFEYFIQNGKFYKIDFNKTIAALSEKELEFFNSFNEKGDYLKARNFLIEKFQDTSFRNKILEFEIEVDEEVEALYNVKKDDIKNQLLIKLNLRNRITNQIIIPGSSIKGAIRTAILNKIANLESSKFSGSANKIEGELLHALNRSNKIDATRDPFKYLKVEDVLLNSSSTRISRVVNYIKKEKGEIEPVNLQMIHEVTKSQLSGNNIKFTLRMNLSSKFFIPNGRGIKITPEFLITSCKEYYHTRLKQIEGSFFKGSQFEDSINRIYEAVNFDKGEFLLRVGRFSGKMSLTLDKYRIGKQPRSRNLAAGEYPMGWIKCRLVEQKEL